MKQLVTLGVRYQHGRLGSFGCDTQMLIRQARFPNEYDDDLDQLVNHASHLCFLEDFDHANRCFKQHTGMIERQLEHWLRKANDEQAMDFIKDLLKADPAIVWTGYRVLGSVMRPSRRHSYVTWTLELFAKHPDTDTEVYSGQFAPNVISS